MGRRVAFGPSSEKPDIARVTSRGVSMRSASGPRPRPSTTLARKLPGTRSADAGMRRNSASPSGCATSSVRLRCWRLDAQKSRRQALALPPVPKCRNGSPDTGFLIFTRSASRSPNGIPAKGPAMNCPHSSPRKPESGFVMGATPVCTAGHVRIPVIRQPRPCCLTRGRRRAHCAAEPPGEAASGGRHDGTPDRSRAPPPPSSCRYRSGAARCACAAAGMAQPPHRLHRVRPARRQCRPGVACARAAGRGTVAPARGAGEPPGRGRQYRCRSRRQSLAGRLKRSASVRRARSRSTRACSQTSPMTCCGMSRRSRCWQARPSCCWRPARCRAALPQCWRLSVRGPRASGSAMAAAARRCTWRPSF